MGKESVHNSAEGEILLLSGTESSTASLDDRIHELLLHISREDKLRFIAYFEAALKRRP